MVTDPTYTQELLPHTAHSSQSPGWRSMCFQKPILVPQRQPPYIHHYRLAETKSHTSGMVLLKHVLVFKKNSFEVRHSSRKGIWG